VTKDMLLWWTGDGGEKGGQGGLKGAKGTRGDISSHQYKVRLNS
jgi:hypothetical protein